MAGNKEKSLIEKLHEIAKIWFDYVKDDEDENGNKIWVDKDGESAFTIYYNSAFFIDFLDFYWYRDWDLEGKFKDIDSFDKFVDWKLKHDKS